jgi:hypothetical protein
MYATLVAASVSGKRVWVVSDGCVGNYEKIVFLSLYP